MAFGSIDVSKISKNVLIVIAFFLSSCSQVSLVGEGMSAGAPAPYGAGAGEYKTNAVDQKKGLIVDAPSVETRSGAKVIFGSNDGLLAGLKRQAGQGRDATTLVDATRQTLSFMGIEKDVETEKDRNHYIETSWYQPNKNERMKVKANIDKRDLNVSSLKLNVLRQSRASSGWKDRSVSPKTVAEIEEAIFKQTKILNIGKEKK